MRTTPQVSAIPLPTSTCTRTTRIRAWDHLRQQTGSSWLILRDDKVYAYSSLGAARFRCRLRPARGQRVAGLGSPSPTNRFSVVDADATDDKVYAYSSLGAARVRCRLRHLARRTAGYPRGITFHQQQVLRGLRQDPQLGDSTTRIYVLESHQRSPDLALWSFGVRDNLR